MYDFCKEYGIAHDRCGKIVVATNPEELPRMAELEKRGTPAPDIERLLPHKVFPGNQPSTTILLSKLSPRTLGALIALYEHKVFVQGVLWGINSFDQWGVELGKEVARSIEPSFREESDLRDASFDASTRRLVAFSRDHR